MPKLLLRIGFARGQCPPYISETFYRKMGMIDGGVDAAKENMTYFEWYRRDSAVVESELDECDEVEEGRR